MAVAKTGEISSTSRRSRNCFTSLTAPSSGRAPATPGTRSPPPALPRTGRATCTVTAEPLAPRRCVAACSPFQPSVGAPSTARTSSPGWMPARSAGEPLMGARTTRRPLAGSDAMSSPTPCTSPSDVTRKSAYSRGGTQRVKGSSSLPSMAPICLDASAGEGAAAALFSPSESSACQSRWLKPPST